MNSSIGTHVRESLNEHPYGLSSTRQAAVIAAAVSKEIMDRANATKQATRPMLSALRDYSKSSK